MPRIVSAPPRETGALSGEKPVARRAKVGLGVGLDVGLGVGLAVVGAGVGAAAGPIYTIVFMYPP